MLRCHLRPTQLPFFYHHPSVLALTCQPKPSLTHASCGTCIARIGAENIAQATPAKSAAATLLEGSHLASIIVFVVVIVPPLPPTLLPLISVVLLLLPAHCTRVHENIYRISIPIGKDCGR